MDRTPLIPPQTRVPDPPAGYPTLGFMAPSSGTYCGRAQENSEWTNLVQLAMSNWNEQAPFYWKNTVDKATTLYGQYCAMDSDAKAAVETTDQL
eukprot:887327-Amphidinium_carterae.1